MVSSGSLSRLALVPLLTIFTLLSCAQGKYGIIKLKAYATEQIPGNIPVDPQGEPLPRTRDTLYTIYVETKDDQIIWDSAWLPGRSFKINPSGLSDEKFEAGMDIISGERIIVRPNPGNQVRLLHLQRTDEAGNPPRPVKTGHILLRGRKNSKLIYQETKTIVVLNLTPSV